MKLKFRGWRREVTSHKHSVFPVEYSEDTGVYRHKGADNPVAWNGPFSASKVSQGCKSFNLNPEKE